MLGCVRDSWGGQCEEGEGGVPFLRDMVAGVDLGGLYMDCWNGVLRQWVRYTRSRYGEMVTMSLDLNASYVGEVGNMGYGEFEGDHMGSRNSFKLHVKNESLSLQLDDDAFSPSLGRRSCIMPRHFPETAPVKTLDHVALIGRRY